MQLQKVSYPREKLFSAIIQFETIKKSNFAKTSQEKNIYITNIFAVECVLDCECPDLSPLKPLDQSKNVTVRTYHKLSRDKNGHIFWHQVAQEGVPATIMTTARSRAQSLVHSNIYIIALKDEFLQNRPNYLTVHYSHFGRNPSKKQLHENIYENRIYVLPKKQDRGSNKGQYKL